MNFTPFKLQNQLKDYFKAKKNTWHFFSSTKIKEDEYETLKTDVLKNYHQLEKNLYPNYYEIIEEVKNVFQLKEEVILYQEQSNLQKNATVFYFNNQVHIVLTDFLLQVLNLDELSVIFAHKLSHVFLYTLDENSYQITERIINAITNDMSSPSSYLETSNLFALYTNLFCDYGSYLACKDRDLVINTLIKIHTGLEYILAQEYLEQVNKVFEEENSRKKQKSHPEIYYRVKSLELLCKDYESGKIEIISFIESGPEIFELGIFSRKKWQKFTFELIQIIMSPLFMQSSLTKNLAKSYFDSFTLIDIAQLKYQNLTMEIWRAAASIKEYFCYILLDFTMVDKKNHDTALIWTLQLSTYFGIKEKFEKIVEKELQLNRLQFKDLYKKSLKNYQNLLSNQGLDMTIFLKNDNKLSQ